MNATSSRSANPFVQNLRVFFGTAQARAVGLVFASDSLLFGSWVAHIPFVKESLRLTDAELGLALFAMPAGLLTMNPLTGWLVGWLGQVRTCFWAAFFLCLFITIPVAAPNVWVLAVALYGIGLCAALINVAMNTLATDVEKAHGITIMSASHGMWSVGGLVGSAVAGLAIANRVPPAWHMLGMAATVLILTLLIRPVLRTIPVLLPLKAASFVRPNRELFLMILIGLAVALGEGVAFDWSAVYLRDSLGASGGVAALGFGAFSLTMTLGRFTGDVLIPHFGAKRLLLGGGLLAAAGLLVAVAVPTPPVALLGFALLGAGCSLGAPILYGAALRVPGIAPAAGLATFATFSFIGFLVGPPLIGVVAEAVGLAWGLVFVAGVLVVAAFLSRFVRLFS